MTLLSALGAYWYEYGIHISTVLFMVSIGYIIGERVVTLFLIL